MRGSRRAAAAAALGLAGVWLLARSNSMTVSSAYGHQQPSAMWSVAALLADEAVGQLGAAAFSVADAAASLAGSGKAAAAAASDVDSAVQGFRATLSEMGAPRSTGVREAAGMREAAPAAQLCLVRRWSAVWLVQQDGTRRYVRFPTPGCIERAASVTPAQLETWPISLGADGVYTLSAEQSRAACESRACAPGDFKTLARPDRVAETASGAPAAATTGAALVVASAATAASDQALPRWMQQATLRFNQAAVNRLSVRQPGDTILIVFGGASVNEMLLNWATHTTKLSMPFVVACMDDKLFQRSEDNGLPAVLMSETPGEANAVTTKWKYYRMDPKAFLTMGLLKVRFFREFIKAGFNVLCSDLDVVWLGDPRPWTEGRRKDSMLLAFADVIVSTDVTGSQLESDDKAWGVHNEMNTGIIFFRSTPSSLVLLEAWLQRMKQELAKLAGMSSNFVQWWTNDQTFFNEVVHVARTLKMNPKSANLADRLAWTNHTSAGVNGARKALLKQVMNRIVEERRGGSAGLLSSLRGVICKELQCEGAACPAERMPFTISTFPYLEFASGHTFFTQSLQERQGVPPISVHTTFQFGDTPEFTWGKRNRLREKKLWMVDSDSYFSRKGPGLHPKEIEYEGFVQLVGPLVDVQQPLVLTESSASIKVEGHGAFSEAMRNNRINVFDLDEGNPNKHLLLDSIQRRLVINLVALGRALKRKVIMPKMMCWCDRYWWLLEDCRFPGVKHEVHPMPFHCPFDHLYDLEKWVHADVPMREYSFLENARVSERDRVDVAYLHVQGAPATDAPPSNRTVTLRPGDDYAAVNTALGAARMQSAFVVKVHARSLELLCESLGTPGANKAFNAMIHDVLGVAEQIRYCDRKAHPWFDAPRGPYDPNKDPLNCTWGFHPPPPLPETSELKCATTIETLLADRRKEVVRKWMGHNINAPNFRAEKRTTVWSTTDRVHDLYREYI